MSGPESLPAPVLTCATPPSDPPTKSEPESVSVPTCATPPTMMPGAARPEPGQTPPPSSSEEDATPEQPYLSPSLEDVIKSRLQGIADRVPATMTIESNAPRQDVRLIDDIGEFLVLSARVWAGLSAELADNRPISQSIRGAHNVSFNTTRLSDLTGVAFLEKEQRKLQKMSDITLQFSQDVKRAWKEEEWDPKKERNPKREK